MSKSHQTCSCCGWSKVTTYQGLRIHQGKMGCTPKGLSIPQSSQYQYSPLSSSSSSSYSYSYSQPAVSYTLPPVKKETYETLTPKYTPETFTPKYTPQPSTKTCYEPVAEAQEKLRSCHCGWSKVTSYQGLRIHQGKMGCTPKGLGIPENLQGLFNSTAPKYEDKNNETLTPKYTPETFTPKYTPQPSTKTCYEPVAEAQEKLRSCHCGWSKVTSYQGLRIHQGKMGCTPKGLGIPENLQGLFNSTAPKYEDKKNAATPEYKPQPSPKTLRDNQDEGFKKEKPPISRPKPALKPKPQSTPVTRGVSLKNNKSSSGTAIKMNNSFCETPQQSRPSTRDGAKTRRALDFSSREKQDMKDIIKALIQSREQKIAQIESSLEASMVSLDKEWEEINDVFAEVIQIVEEARMREENSLDIRKESLNREANSVISKIQEDIKKLEDARDDMDTGANIALLTLESEEFSLSSLDFATLQINISTMMKQIQQEVDKLSALDLKRVASFEVDVKFIPSSTHKWPAVLHTEWKIPDGGQSWQFSRERFGFKSGRAFWKVQVSDERCWALGVVSAKSNHMLTRGTDDVYKAVCHFEREKCSTWTVPLDCSPLRDRPQKVGVFLDYDEGLLSFYNVTDQRHIYTFTECAFTGEVFPYIHMP